MFVDQQSHSVVWLLDHEYWVEWKGDRDETEGMGNGSVEVGRDMGFELEWEGEMDVWGRERLGNL